MVNSEFEGTGVIVRELVSCLLLVALYWVLLSLAVSYLPSPSFHMPEWWYPTFGQNSASAVLWMQLDNSIKVLAAAIPVAFIISYWFGQRWLRVSVAVGLLAALAMSFLITFNFYFLVQEHSIKLDPSNIASAIIDALKVAVILLVAAWALARVLPSNKALQRTEEK